MSQPKTADRQKASQTTCSGTGLVRITTRTDDSTGSAISGSSCGWDSGVRARRKVAEDAAERHVNKRHGGMAMWL